ncbi:hypothetical protein TW78_10180, partial [Vibrio coralliilyticus]
MSDFRFLYPEWLLVLLPLCGLVFWLSKRSRNQTLIAPHLAKAMGIQHKSARNAVTSAIAFCGLIATIALSGPSFTSAERPSFSNDSARVLIMDMSMSMYATDIKPNRLTQTKYKASDLLKKWSEGTTGLVAYAGDAYTVSPMTSDTRTIQNLIPNLSPELMPYPGADAVKAVRLAIDMMKNAGLSRGDIILFSDDLDDAETQGIQGLLEGTHWRLSILGVGTRSGAPIRLSDGTLLKTDAGQTVVAKSNFSNMNSVSKSLGGFFTPIQLNNSDIDAIANRTSSIESTGKLNQAQQISDRVNSGIWLVPLLIIPALLMFRRGFLFSMIILAYPLLSPKPAMASAWLNSNQQAKQLYDAEQYQEAADLFENKEWQGIAQYQAGNFPAAINALKDSQTLNGKYNLANAYAQNREFNQAISLYEDVLKQDPGNEDAKKNLEIVRQQQQQQQ